MRKILVFIAVAAVNLALGAGAAWFLKPAPAVADPTAASHGNATVEATASPSRGGSVPASGYTYAIKDRVVSLADASARRYLKVSLVLAMAESTARDAKRKGPPSAAEEKKFTEEFGNLHGAQVQDALTTLLSARRAEEILQPDGREVLREDIRSRLNSLLPPDEQVAHVLITDFIVQ